jgi:radical SAM protein with 4Fe4S-binding SPASM domain
MNKEEMDIKLGGTKKISLSDSISITAKRENDSWGIFDENWGFVIHDIPKKFRTKSKYNNFILSKREEEEKKIRLKSKPYNYVIEPTNICNLQCPLCSTGVGAKTRDKGKMTLENFKKFIDEIKDVAIQISLQNWGESTLVKELPLMIKYASDNNIFVNLSTNFSVNYSENYLEELMKSGLGVLLVDLDGTTNEIYKKYRVSGDLDQVLKNIEMIVKFKKKYNIKYPIIKTKMLVMKHNEHQIEDFKKLSKKLEVDEIELGNIQMNPNTAKDWLPKNPEYRYATYEQDGEVEACHWPWSGMVVNWNGDVSACCIVDDANSDFGNIFEFGLEKVWNNEYYVSARSEFSKEKDMTKHTICNICKNNTHNPNLFRIGDTFSITSNSNVKLRD